MKRLLLIGFELEAQYVEQIRDQATEFEVVECTSREKLAEFASRTEILFSYFATKEFFERAKALRWIHSVSAGVNQWMVPKVLDSDIILTNSSGIHGIPISELILAQMLGFATGMNLLMRAQMTKDTEVRRKVNQTKFELEGQTVGVIGLGSIGDTLAFKAKGLGMRVLGLKRNPVEKPPYVDELYGPEQLSELLRQSDHVALCLPLTAETKELIGERELAMMKPTAYIYNIGRGATIDQDALITALQEGRIAGAGLDVTTPDPPTPESPLWEMPNVMLSLHTSGSSPTNDMRVTDLFLKNLRRYVEGMPLLNIVSKELEY